MVEWLIGSLVNWFIGTSAHQLISTSTHSTSDIGTSAHQLICTSTNQHIRNRYICAGCHAERSEASHYYRFFASLRMTKSTLKTQIILLSQFLIFLRIRVSLVFFNDDGAF